MQIWVEKAAMGALIQSIFLRELRTLREQLKLVGPCIQNAQRKTDEASPAG